MLLQQCVLMPDKLTELLQSLSATLDADSGSKYSTQREVKKVLIVAITSNRGLCGAFNSNIIKASHKINFPINMVVKTYLFWL